MYTLDNQHTGLRQLKWLSSSHGTDQIAATIFCLWKPRSVLCDIQCTLLHWHLCAQLLSPSRACPPAHPPTHPPARPPKCSQCIPVCVDEYGAWLVAHGSWALACGLCVWCLGMYACVCVSMRPCGSAACVHACVVMSIELTHAHT